MSVGYSDGSLIVDTGLNNAGFFRDAKQFKGAVESLKNTVNRVGQDMAKSGNGYAQSIQRGARASREFEAELKQLEAEAEALKSILENPAKGVENDIKKLEAELSKTKEIMDGMTGPGAKLDLDAWDAARKKVASLTEQIEALEKRRAELSAPAYRYTAEYMNMANAYNAVAAKIEQMRATSNAAGGGFAAVARNATDAAATLARMAGRGVILFLRKLASGARNAAVQLAKLSGKALANGIKAIGSAASRAGQALLGMGKRARQSNGGIQLSLRNILRYGLGIRSLFALFNRLRNAIKEGFETLSNYDPRVKAALASLKGALNGLKGSLAGAFAPILTAIAPALTTFINLLATAINSIGMFMAALTGQGYYMAAKGIEAVDSAAGGASGSVKELKRQLAGFDELNILSAGTSGGSGGGGSAGAGYGYDRIPIEGGIADFVQRMKQLFQAGEYEEIGAIIADGINGAFQRVQDFIRWENIGGTVTRYVDAFAGAFNGLVKRINWKNIGKTFGDGLNTIVNTLERWYKKLNFANVGKAIGEALNGMVQRVNFAKAGATLARMLTAKLVVAANALATFNWEKFGPKLAEGFNRFISTLDEVIGGIDWADMARKMVRGLNGFIRHIEWRELGETIAKRAESLIDMLKAVLTEFEWGDTGDKFAEALNGFFKRKSLWKKAGETIDTAIKGLLDFTKRFLVRFDARTAAQRIRDALERIDWKGIASDFWEAAKIAFKKAGDFLDVLLGDDIENDSTSLSQKIGSAINRALKGAINWADDILQDFDEEAVTQAIIEVLGEIHWAEIADAIIKMLGNALGNFTGVIQNLIVGGEKGKEKLIKGTREAIGVSEKTFSDADLEKLIDEAKIGVSPALMDKDERERALAAREQLKALQENTDAVQKVKQLQTPQESIWGPLFPNAQAEEYSDAVDEATKRINKALNDKEYQYNATKDPYNSSYNGPTSSMEQGWEWNFGEQTVDVEVNFSPADDNKPAYKNGGLLKYLQTIFDPGTDEETRIQLIKDAWDTVSQWVSGYGGEKNVSQGIGLVRSLWQTVSSWVNGLKGNTKVEQIVGLITAAWSTVSAWVNGLKGNTKVQQAVDLVKGWYGSAKSYLGLDNLDTTAWVDADSPWDNSSYQAKRYLGLSDLTATIDIFANLTNSAKNTINSIATTISNAVKSSKKSNGMAGGGIITAGGVSRAFANGGAVTDGGRTRWWNSIPKYAGGTSRAHGTLFAAGEAGPEIIGHVNGRTEILNQSQLAQTMRGAVTGGMIAALRGIEFRLPAMATGSVVPYDVSAQIAKSSAELQSTLDANNEDLIQTIISVAGQIVAAVNSLQAQQRNGGGAGGLNVQQVINEINRRTQMFAASPLS